MKKLFVLVIALLLCLSACGGSSDTAGDDWRTSGIVVADGTITHDGESVDVLVTISDTSAAFYRDTAEQVLFDSVLFPESIPDAKQAFESISFDDINGDGESDVIARFKFNDGGGEELVWIWDPAERYIFNGELSTITHAEEETEPYFTANGLLTNGEVGKGRVKLKDGASFYANLGEDYDGLVFAAEAQPDNYKDSAKRMQLDSIAPEAAIMDIPTLDPHGNLYFTICG